MVTPARVAVLALFASGCGGARPVLQPSAQPIAHRGVNLGPERMTPEYLRSLAALGCALTLRVPVRSPSEARDVRAAVVPYPSLSVLLLVETPNLGLVASLVPIAQLPQVAAVELGNELDLYGLTPQQFGAFVLAAYRQLRDGGYNGPIISGGIYSTQRESLDYLRAASVDWPMDVVLGVHPYTALDDATLADLQAFGHPLAATEYGMPSRTAIEDAAQAAYLTAQGAMLQLGGFQWALIYQLVSGPSASNLDNFGLLRFDGSAKPSYAMLCR